MFCTYNFVFNEARNNNDIKTVANTVLNEVPYCNDATCVGNNVHLTAAGAQKFFVAASYIAIMQKSRLTRDERGDTITRKVHADGNKLCSRKEWRLYTQ